jgi:uncharacterized protein
MSLHIYIDADACPVKDEAVRIATRYSLPITFVSNSSLNTIPGPTVRQMVVAAGFDAADDWIVENAVAWDIVVTADIPLAARCLERGCRVLKHNGQEWTNDTIGSALAMRELTAYLRQAGEIAGHNPSFTKRDRSEFLQSLDRLIHKRR